MQPALSCTSAVSSKSWNNPPQFAGRHFVGWVHSAHGIRGEIFVRLAAGQADWLDSLESLFLLLPTAEALSEFAIEVARPHKDGLIVRLKGVTDRNRSEELRKSSVYIDSTLLTAEPGERVFLKQILGFTVVNAGVKVGAIVGFASNGPQDLLRVKTQAHEALIPFVDDFIVQLDFDKREVNMNFPPDLLTLDEDS